MSATTTNLNPDILPKRTPSHGLTAAQVLEQRQQHGENRLPSAKRTSAWVIFFDQFKNPLIYIILAAAAISLAVGEYGDFAIIMAVVVLDAILGFIQEYQAQRTYRALKGLLRPTTTVIRDGVRQEVQVHEIVPGDLVILNAGEHVPGDGQVLMATKLAIEEAILTGESEAVVKTPVEGQNQVYMGTTALTGRGLIQVTATGSYTELGQIATSLHDEIEDKIQ